MKIKKYFSLLFIATIIFNSCIEKKNNDNFDNEIQTSLTKLKNKNYSEAWVVVNAGLSDNYIQFFSYDNEVYFDFPIFSEIKSKYKDERFDENVDTTGNDTFFKKYLTSSQVRSLKSLLKKYNFIYEKVRLGYIEPTLFNQSDTTGWVTTLRGIFSIDFSKSKEFIDEYFVKVYGYKKDSIYYSIEEN